MLNTDFPRVKFKSIKKYGLAKTFQRHFSLWHVQGIACIGMTLEAEFLNDPVSGHWLSRIYGCLMPAPTLAESCLWELRLST